jgi:hypothetical protein
MHKKAFDNVISNFLIFSSCFSFKLLHFFISSNLTTNQNCSKNSKIIIKKIQEISSSRTLRNSIPNAIIKHNQLW